MWCVFKKLQQQGFSQQPQNWTNLCTSTKQKLCPSHGVKLPLYARSDEIHISAIYKYYTQYLLMCDLGFHKLHLASRFLLLVKLPSFFFIIPSFKTSCRINLIRFSAVNHRLSLYIQKVTFKSQKRKKENVNKNRWTDFKKPESVSFALLFKNFPNSFLVKKIGQTFRVQSEKQQCYCCFSIALDNSSAALTIVKNWWLACPTNNAKECIDALDPSQKGQQLYRFLHFCSSLFSNLQ